MGGDKPPEEPCLSVNASRPLIIEFDLSILSFVDSIASPDVNQGITGSYGLRDNKSHHPKTQVSYC
ncbi:hypothetical protein K443DRAFT_677501 [Laccaria amethystina LaAM-08-1]|uniref:Uncharacterized protein n=1 Tax=Laccaria amethystina LaAM-08-1 TaxID=1095629 RepID=A0A0C9Y366_9AGAR|nr:hypothetical protein K443DRAFT_677501 [Laccaria amethystina LaAM-08-1]